MLAAPARQQQIALPFPEHSLYLESERQATHFAVLWRDSELSKKASEARKAAELLQCHINFLYKNNPENDYIPELRAQLTEVKRHYLDKRQKCFPVADLPKVIPLLPKNRDTWISQSLFNTPKNGPMTRRKTYFSSSSVLFADLDYYKAGHYTSPDAVLARVLQLIEDKGWPAPSIALFSGRGIYIKWLLAHPLPRPALPRWEAAEREIIKLLNTVPELGVDTAVKDVSRVLRLEHTINEKTGEAVRILWINEAKDGAPKEYNFQHCLGRCWVRHLLKVKLAEQARSLPRKSGSKWPTLKLAGRGLLPIGKELNGHGSLKRPQHKSAIFLFLKTRTGFPGKI
jgi:hypothetical protein